MLTEEQLLEIEARCNAATPGPWDSCTAICGSGDSAIIAPIHGRSCVLALVCAEVDEQGKDVVRSMRDAAFIAAARTDVPALVAEVRRLSEAISELEVLYVTEKMNRFALKVANKENE